VDQYKPKKQTVRKLSIDDSYTKFKKVFEEISANRKIAVSVPDGVIGVFH
jgi:hypothetical protein